jgi:hypothetical protein
VRIKVSIHGFKGDIEHTGKFGDLERERQREREMKQNRTRPEYLTTKVIDSKTLEALLQYPPNS